MGGNTDAGSGDRCGLLWRLLLRRLLHLLCLLLSLLLRCHLMEIACALSAGHLRHIHTGKAEECAAAAFVFSCISHSIHLSGG